MTKNTSVSLSDHFCQFIDKQVDAGHYGSASEVVRAGLRLLEQHEAKVERLRQALIEGERSGPAGPLDMEEIIRKAKDEAIARRADAKAG